MSPAMEAHLRLLSTLPSRVHVKVEPPELVRRLPTGRAASIPRWKIRRMSRLEAAGVPRYMIAKELRVSRLAVWRKLGKKKFR